MTDQDYVRQASSTWKQEGLYLSLVAEGTSTLSSIASNSERKIQWTAPWSASGLDDPLEKSSHYYKELP